MPIRDTQYSIHEVNPDGTRGQEIHPHNGTPASADGWAKSLAKERSIRAEAVDNKSGRVVGSYDERKL